MSGLSDPAFQEDLLAELLAINQTVHLLLDGQADASGDRIAYLARFLERGLTSLSSTNLWSGPEDRRVTVQENAAARFSDIVGSVRR